MLDVVLSPGLLSVHENDVKKFADHGFKWISYQVQNGGGIADATEYFRDARNVGLSVGAWGVTYGRGEFYRDGKALAQQALKHGADHLIMNAEACAVGTRPDRGCLPIIQGARDGGWAGPVHLCTPGTPTDWRYFDFMVDTQSFLETGGGLLVEAYFNEYDYFRPINSVNYWLRMGIPRDRINVMIETATAPAGSEKAGKRMGGLDWLPYLLEAGTGCAFSIFIAEDTHVEDCIALENLARSAPPHVEVPVTAAEVRAEVVKITKEWEATQKADISLTRLHIVRRIVDTGSTDARWNICKREIRAALDNAGIKV